MPVVRGVKQQVLAKSLDPSGSRRGHHHGRGQRSTSPASILSFTLISLPNHSYLPCRGHRRRGGCVLLLVPHNGSPASRGDVRRIPKPTVSNRALGPTPVCSRRAAAPPKSPLEIGISVCDTNGSRASYESCSIRQCAWRARLTDSRELAGETTAEFLCADV